MTLDDSAVVLGGIILPADARVGPLCVLGVQPDGEPRPPTTLGRGAVLRAGVVLYAGSVIGARFHGGDGARVREGAAIGDGVSIGAGSVVEHDVVLEDDVRLHSLVFVPELTIVRRGAWIGPGTVLTNARYPASPGAKDSLEGAELGERCRIGANVTILPGVRIGPAAVVGAGAVVVHDVPEGAVVVGNPARVSGRVEDLDAYR